MVSGGCLCGDVRFEVSGRFTPISHCHCSKCRKASGSAFNSGIACKASRFRWLKGQERVERYVQPSGFRRDFCRTCGSPVPRADEGDYFATLPAGSLDADPGTRAIRHIWVGSKAPWYDFGEEVAQYEEGPPPEQELRPPTS
jgi:hypothetical protein